jgi:hypothetical protein
MGYSRLVQKQAFESTHHFGNVSTPLHWGTCLLIAGLCGPRHHGFHNHYGRSKVASRTFLTGVSSQAAKNGLPLHTEVSRKSVAALVVECISDPKNLSHKNFGVNEPNTDDKPAFY